MSDYTGPGEAGVRRVVAEASRLPVYDPNDQRWRGAANAAWTAVEAAAWNAAWAAAMATRAEVVADLLTPDQYQTLTAPWQVYVDTFGLAEEGA